MNIVCLGWYGSNQNLGDHSYKLTFPIVFPKHNLQFTEKIENINGIDAVFVGGGNVANLYYINQLKNFNIKKYMFSVGIISTDPINEFQQFEEVYVRDYKSLQYFNKANYIPDFAFILNGDKNNGNQLIKKYFTKADLYKNKIAIVINAHLLPTHESNANNFIIFEQLCYSLARIIDNTNASFIFVPFCTSYPDDRISNGIVYSRCKFWKKNVLIYDCLSVQDALDIFASVDLVISSRLHASIFSCVCGKPFIDITHHDKNLNFLETINKLNWSVNYWNFDKNKFETLLQHFMQENYYEKELLSISNNNSIAIKELSKKFN